MSVSLLALATAACEPNGSQQGFVPEPIKVENQLLTPEILWQLGRLGDAKISPDGLTVAFALTYTNIAEDRSYTDLYTIPLAGGEPTRLTFTTANEMQISWTPDGQYIAYLLGAPEGAQLWEISPDGTNAKQVSDIKGGIDGYIYSPDGQYVAFTHRVKEDTLLTDRHSDMPKATARLETDLMYRHWNSWTDGSYSHLFLAKHTDGKLSEAHDLMAGERYHTPLPPFGGMEQITFSPCGRKLIYTSKKLTGLAAAKSTNSGLYCYDITSGETSLLTPDNMGYDINPQFSASGKLMFWLSMEHDGYESDKKRLMMRNLETSETTDLTNLTELTVSSFCVSNDEKNVFFIANQNGVEAVFALDIASHQIRTVNADRCDHVFICEANENELLTSRMSMQSPQELFVIDKETGSARQLTHINTQTLSELNLGEVTERWIPTTDGKQMHTWVILPPNFDPQKKYPTLLYCQGGPQSTVSQFWSTRWNFALMAANGYVVVAPNRRGLPGFGREWNEQISGDYGGQNMRDYLSAIDAVSQEPWVDIAHRGAVGASYGGYSVYWLAGNHAGRFSAFIAHCGVFDYSALYPTTEEIFFPDWDLKGAPWDLQNAAAQRSYAASPSKFVNYWNTPIMVIHGEKDFRIPYTQGMAAFNTAVMKGVPAQFLYFPDECHWILKPQNSIVWHREFFAWLDKWLKKKE